MRRDYLSEHAEAERRPGDTRPEILSGRLAWPPVEAHAALEIDLPSVFAAILGS